MAAMGAASTMGLVVGGLGIASDITALASIALEESHPAVASVLGWTSMATGLAGVGVGIRGVLRVRPVSHRLRENTPLENLPDESFNTFDIFRSHKNDARRVIITAHGSQPFRSSYARLENGQSIRYYGGEGHSIVAETLNLAYNDYLPRETLNGPGKIRNYTLSHYEPDAGVRLKRIADRTGVDIILITKQTDLKNVLEELKSKGGYYKIIEGSFCRNR